MRGELIRIVVLCAAGMLGMAFVLPWLRGQDASPTLLGIVAVALVATNLLRSFRVPLWRLRRRGRSRGRQNGKWWPRGVRQPALAERRSSFGATPILACATLCAAVFAGVFFWPADMPSPAALAIGRPPSAPSAGTFPCTVTGVHDGDGPIYCAEGPKIRLQAIAAREADESCRPGHPCPPASGAAATAALRKLALGKVLRCEATGTSYSRVTAWCRTAEGVELNCAMVGGGTVAYWRRYDPEGRLCRS